MEHLLLGTLHVLWTQDDFWIFINYEFQRISYQGTVGLQWYVFKNCVGVYITRYSLICKPGYWHILHILFRGCWCPGTARHQVINSHGIQYVLGFGHFRLIEFRLYWRIRVLDSVKCPCFLSITLLSRPPRRHELGCASGLLGKQNLLKILNSMIQTLCSCTAAVTKKSM